MTDQVAHPNMSRHKNRFTFPHSFYNHTVTNVSMDFVETNHAVTEQGNFESQNVDAMIPKYL